MIPGTQECRRISSVTVEAANSPIRHEPTALAEKAASNGKEKDEASSVDNAYADESEIENQTGV